MEDLKPGPRYVESCQQIANGHRCVFLFCDDQGGWFDRCCQATEMIHRIARNGDLVMDFWIDLDSFNKAREKQGRPEGLK